MTLEELKAEAKAQGYNLIPIKKREKFLPCKCGCNRRITFYSYAPNEVVTLECARCGFRVVSSDERNPAKDWNQAVKEKTEDEK